MANLIKVDAAAERLGFSPAHVRKLIARRAIPYKKMSPSRNGPVRFDPDELDRWVASHAVPAQD